MVESSPPVAPRISLFPDDGDGEGDDDESDGNICRCPSKGQENRYVGKSLLKTLVSRP